LSKNAVVYSKAIANNSDRLPLNYNSSTMRRIRAMREIKQTASGKVYAII
jgi:hypothetical protein